MRRASNPSETTAVHSLTTENCPTTARSAVRGRTVTEPNLDSGRPHRGGGFRPPPKKKRTVRNVFLKIVALLIVVGIVQFASANSPNNTTPRDSTDNSSAGSHSNGPTTKSSTDHNADVQIASCVKDPLSGYLVADVKVTNSSSESSNYNVTVTFNNGSEQIDAGMATINNLDPGSSFTQQTVSLKSHAPARFTCRVEETTRSADG